MRCIINELAEELTNEMFKTSSNFERTFTLVSKMIQLEGKTDNIEFNEFINKKINNIIACKKQN